MVTTNGSGMERLSNGNRTERKSPEKYFSMTVSLLEKERSCHINEWSSNG